MPMSRNVRSIRRAISPRFAMSTRLNAMFDSKSNYSMMPTVQSDSKEAFYDGFICRQINRQPL
jgi:hypothetical protein